MQKVTKAIIPVAGLGTRFLPAVKAMPKEMLPVIDKPVIQYIIEEAVLSGIKDIILITGQTKRAIEDHFDRNFELEYRLGSSGKKKILKEIKAISKLANFIYIRQKQPRGCGDAILCAKELVKNEPCAILFGDDIIEQRPPVLGQMIKVFAKYGDPVMAVEKIPKKDISHYGVVKAQKVEKNIYQISALVEKPRPEKAPSNLGIVGRYIITPEVLEILEKVGPAEDGEIRLIDAFIAMVKSRPLYAYEFEGRRYDCGKKFGWLKANVEMVMKHGEIGKRFRKYLRKISKS